MALVIDNDGAHREYPVAGSVIVYSLCGWGEVQALREECRDEGNALRVDGVKLNEELLRRHVHGWENVQDRAGKAVPYSLDALMHLPAAIVEDLIVCILSAATAEQEEQGNSGGSSSI